MPKVLICDNLAIEGKEYLEQQGITCDISNSHTPDELKAMLPDYDGIIVRSKTKMTAEVIASGTALKIIGRAGTGVDNVDLDAATKNGILVVNAPESNTHSTAELTFSMLLALSRNIPQACASVKADEWQKQRFKGVEVTGKTLGILGFGRIGSHVAQYASGLDMQVIVHDPYVSEEAVKRVNATAVDMNTLLATADYITVHTPMTPETKGMINDTAFAKMKEGVRIINCARGGIIDEAALLRAMESGKVAGAALDVFEVEPPQDRTLIDRDDVIATPHLGASTSEAQKNVAHEIAERLEAYFSQGRLEGAVNLPKMDHAAMDAIAPYMTLSEKLGAFAAQMMEGQLAEIQLHYSGEPGAYDTTPLTRSALRGFLGCICEEPINFVNAELMAKQRGIRITESKSSDVTDFAALIRIAVKTDKETVSIAGTIFGAKNDPRIVRINDYHVDAIPAGKLIIIHNVDRAGTIGRIGTVLGNHGINIADMTLGRNIEQAKAVVLINIDGDLDEAVIKDIQEIEGILIVRVVSL